MAYILFHWHPRLPSTIRVVIKRKYFAYFISFKSIYFKYVNSGPKYKATISHGWCGVLRLYFYSYRIWRLLAFLKDRRMLESFGINSNQDSPDWVNSKMDLNIIYYFKFQTWNLDFQPAYNKCKLTTQLIGCSSTISYKIFPTQYKNYILVIHSIFSYSKVQ